MTALDDTDHRLIALLRKDARLSAATLAAKLGVSRGTVTNRLRRLEDEGVIVSVRHLSQIGPEASTVRAILPLQRH
jgi:DNA-binding Lrp family transcriptional regulator